MEIYSIDVLGNWTVDGAVNVALAQIQAPNQQHYRSDETRPHALISVHQLLSAADGQKLNDIFPGNQPRHIGRREIELGAVVALQTLGHWQARPPHQKRIAPAG